MNTPCRSHFGPIDRRETNSSDTSTRLQNDVQRAVPNVDCQNSFGIWTVEDQDYSDAVKDAAGWTEKYDDSDFDLYGDQSQFELLLGTHDRPVENDHHRDIVPPDSGFSQANGNGSTATISTWITSSSLMTADDNVGTGRILDKYFYQPMGRALERRINQMAWKGRQRSLSSGSQTKNEGVALLSSYETDVVFDDIDATISSIWETLSEHMENSRSSEDKLQESSSRFYEYDKAVHFSWIATAKSQHDFFKHRRAESGLFNFDFTSSFSEENISSIEEKIQRVAQDAESLDFFLSVKALKGLIKLLTRWPFLRNLVVSLFNYSQDLPTLDQVLSYSEKQLTGYCETLDTLIECMFGDQHLVAEEEMRTCCLSSTPERLYSSPTMELLHGPLILSSHDCSFQPQFCPAFARSTVTVANFIGLPSNFQGNSAPNLEKDINIVQVMFIDEIAEAVIEGTRAHLYMSISQERDDILGDNLHLVIYIAHFFASFPSLIPWCPHAYLAAKQFVHDFGSPFGQESLCGVADFFMELAEIGVKRGTGVFSVVNRERVFRLFASLLK